jgi:methylmalonyl-CoA/ethylmalonyl-CoA epimerase
MMSKTLPIDFEFDHVGIAVESLTESSKFYLAMGFQEGHTEIVEREKVKVIMFELNNDSRIELLEPTSPESTIAKFLKNRGPGIHHICLRVKDIRKTLKKLKQEKFRLIHEEPFLGAHECEVAFVHPQSTGGVLIELSQPRQFSHRGGH